MRVLIAEDHPDIAAITSQLVALAGHSVSVAKDGFDAVRMAGEIAPDVVLLDINMPGLDGYETAQQLRKLFDPSVQIYAVTATIVDRALARRSGFDGVFRKPLNLARSFA